MDAVKQGIVFYREDADPVKVKVRKPSVTDHYDLDFLSMPGSLGGTTVLHSLHDPGRTLVVLQDQPGWEAWLAEVDAPPAPASTVVGQQIEEIQEATGLSDPQLAAAFPGGVSRETVNRWRHLPNPNLRRPNLYRLGVLHDLARRLEEAGIDARVWLHQPVQGEEVTPYSLICGGQLGRVRAAVDAIAAGYGRADEAMKQREASRDWDPVIDDPDDDDDGAWMRDDMDEASE